MTPLLGGHLLFSFLFRLLCALSSDLLEAFLPGALVDISNITHRVRLRHRTDVYLLDVLGGFEDRIPVLKERKRYTLTLAVGHKVCDILVFLRRS